MRTLVVRGPASIDGETSVPGDKSISHRALMVAAIASGRSVLRGIGPGEDVASTRRCIQAYGVNIRNNEDALSIDGQDIDAWREPASTLDCGNSGTTMRLLSGLAARLPFASQLDGDASLRRRPMDRIVRPLRELGAHVEAVDDRFPPIVVKGGALTGTDVVVDVPSAQVKSCVILAALGAAGRTTIALPVATRDHTERMLLALGGPIDTRTDNGRAVIGIEAFVPEAFDYEVPGDVSSASFLVAAALLCGRVTVGAVGLNPTRTGFLEICARMGADVAWSVEGTVLGEDVGTIQAAKSALQGVGVEGPTVPLMIDELPLVAVLATAASGPTVVTDAGELRIKESDRIHAMAEALRSMGGEIDERDDGFEVRGPTTLRGATVSSCGDHRVAMALAVAALRAEGETRIEGFDSVGVSWPGFHHVLTTLGADVELV